MARVSDLLLAELTRRIKAHQDLTVTLIEKWLGHRPGWWKSRRRPTYKGLTVDELVKVCALVKVDPDELLGAAMAASRTGSDAAAGNPFASLPLSKVPPIISAARRHPGPPTAAFGDREIKAEDDRRYEAPLPALRVLIAAVARREVPAACLASAVAVAGSCYRMLGAAGEARACLDFAWQHTADPARHADIAQRYVYVLGPPQAAEAARTARELWSELADVGRIGQTLVDSGYAAFETEKFPAAQRYLEAAGRYALPEKYEFARLQGLGLCWAKLGDRATALDHLERAAQAAAEHLAASPGARGRYWWTRGELEGDPALLERAIFELLPSHVFEAAQACWELCSQLAAKRDFAAMERLAEAVRLRCPERSLIPIFEDLQAAARLEATAGRENAAAEALETTRVALKRSRARWLRTRLNQLWAFT